MYYYLLIIVGVRLDWGWFGEVRVNRIRDIVGMLIIAISFSYR